MREVSGQVVSGHLDQTGKAPKLLTLILERAVIFQS